MTKCNNCRFRAKDEDGDIAGRIKISERGTVYLFVDGQGNKGFLADRMQKMGITDFEIVPRDPETYQDWQVGDIIWDSHGSGANGRIIFRSGEFVAADIDGMCICYTCKEMFNDGYRLVLTYIENQIIDEKTKYEPQDGDIVAWKDKEDNGKFAITISRGKECGYFTLFTNGTIESSYCTLDMNIVRPATDEEKQLLFDAMAKAGKRWNAEKKVVEDIPEPYEFKKGEPVLVRNHDYELWSLFAYHEQAGDKHIVKTCFQTVLQSQCIPYNEKTMHLLGTSEDYKEE